MSLDYANQDNHEPNTLDDDYTCAYPGECLMPSIHTRAECHTVEDMEAYYTEMEIAKKGRTKS